MRSIRLGGLPYSFNIINMSFIYAHHAYNLWLVCVCMHMSFILIISFFSFRTLLSVYLFTNLTSSLPASASGNIFKCSFFATLTFSLCMYLKSFVKRLLRRRCGVSNKEYVFWFHYIPTLSYWIPILAIVILLSCH